MIFKGIDFTKTAVALLTIKVMMASQALIAFPVLLDDLCVVFAVGILGMKILKNHLEIKKICFYGIVTVPVILTCYVIRQYDLLITLIAVFLMKDESFDEYVDLILKIEVLMTAGIFLLSLCFLAAGSEKELVLMTGSRVRYTGGFLHPNLFSCHFLSCVLMYLWLNYHNMNRKKYLMIVILTGVVHMFTKTRTSWIICMFLLIFHAFMKKEPVQNWCKKYLKFGFPVIGGFMFYAMISYLQDHSLILFLDDLLTGRIELAAYAYDQSGLTLVPRYLDYVQSSTVELDTFWGLTTFAFDNIYTFLFIQLGLLWFIAFTVIIYLLIKKTDTKCHFFILGWLLYAITEVQGLNGFRFFPILLLTLLFEHKEKTNVKTVA